MLFAVLQNDFLLGLIALINATFGGIITVLAAWMNLRAKQQAVKLEEMSRVGRQTRAIVDGTLTLALRVAADALTKLAEKDSSPENVAAAKKAKEEWKNQEKNVEEALRIASSKE